VDDFRHALRLMWRQKAFTAAALVTLALGIGANTAIFSMTYGVLLRPLPYSTADRLVRLSESHPGGTPIVRSPVLSNVTFHAWRRNPRTIDGLAGYTQGAMTLDDRDGASRIVTASVSPALFALLGVRPGRGRLLHEEDARPGAPRVVVLAAGFWQEHFGADETIVGRSLTIDAQPYTVVGVAPAGFYFPDRQVRLWTVLTIPDTAASQRAAIFAALALLRPGVSAAQAAAEATAAARADTRRHPSFNLLFGAGGPPMVSARPLLEDVTSRVRPALTLLLVSVTLVLLIACANVANLLLSRGVARQREFAVRAAVGAARGRLVRQLLTESLVLAGTGGALGLALAWVLVRVLPSVLPEDFPRLADVRLDAPALVFAVAASATAGILAGMLPAVRLADLQLVPALREGSGASAGARTRRLGALLLVAEAAFAVMLLVAAALLGRSFVRLLAVDPGYDPHNVLMARVHLPPQPASAENREETFAAALVDRVRALPGVTAAGASNMAPFMSPSAVMSMTLAGDSIEPIAARAMANVITPGYANALSFDLRQGRLFDERDRSAAIRPILVNEEFARAYLSDGKPVVGRRFAASFTPDATVEIVGVVANVLKDGLDAAPQPEIYNLPRDRFGFPPSINLAIRAAGDPLTLIAPLREAVRAVDRGAALDEVEPLGTRISDSVREPRFAMAILVAFAAIATMLAAVGLYGVLSYQVWQRRRELGVRAALGASRPALLRLVLRQGLAVTAAGILLGLVGAAWAARSMQALLFGVEPHDALAFSVAPLVLLLVAAAAVLVPARRAASANPIEALKCE